MAETASWSGHVFTVYNPDDDLRWREVGGLYVFAGLEEDWQGQSQWLAMYIGRCQAFSKRLPNHEKWPEAVLLGATHIHAMVETNAFRRKSLEEDLIEEYQPYLNTLLKG